MRTNNKSHNNKSPFSMLTELAVEGTSSVVEVQRTFLDLIKQENDIVFNGVRERIANFVPAVAVTDLAQRGLDAVIEMQQELLTSTSKQTLQWLESEQAGKPDRTTHLVEFAREGVETFTRAQKRFLEAVAEEAAAATGNRRAHADTKEKKTELTQLAREAGCAFIEAQKRLLDVMGQQMNVNLDVATQSMELMSPSRLLPVATRTGESVKNFFNAEKDLIGSLSRVGKKSSGRAKSKARKGIKKETVAV